MQFNYHTFIAWLSRLWDFHTFGNALMLTMQISVQIIKMTIHIHVQLVLDRKSVPNHAILRYFRSCHLMQGTVPKQTPNLSVLH